MPFLRPAAALAAALAVASPAHADTIHVPGDYPTIQQAINAAEDGDEVLVAPGIYAENIDFLAKAIHLRSDADGDSATYDLSPSNTIIDGAQAGTVVVFQNGEGSRSIIEGFSIINGSGPNATRGGGIRCSHSSPTIRHNRICSNRTNQDGDGGGIFCESSSAMVLSNVICHNFAHDGGGIFVAYEGDAVIANNVVWANDASFGGGVYVARSAAVFANNTLTDNVASTLGGGLRSWESSASVSNSILWGNDSAQIENAGPPYPVVEYSDVEGGWPGTGNISADPNFLDRFFHLTSDSPCVNTGSNDAVATAADFEGDNRIVGSLVDMGADEFATGPLAHSVSPDRGRYDQSVSARIFGIRFADDTSATVFFGDDEATDVVIVSDSQITCTTPTGSTGPVNVTVANAIGSGTLDRGYMFTPALLISGDHRPGGNAQISYLLDSSDSILAIYGLNQVDIPTPPFDGSLCIAPFQVLFLIASWPFDQLDVDLPIPNDPALSGLEIFLQGLIGPSLVFPKDAAWTNCGVLDIQ